MIVDIVESCGKEADHSDFAKICVAVLEEDSGVDALMTDQHYMVDDV